jgi:hypothetical protein
MSRLQHLITRTTAAATLAAALLASPALAEDGKGYAGSFCQPNFSGNRDGYSIGFNVQSGQFLPGEGMDVSCPIVKDANAGGIKRAFVMVVDQTSGSVSCTLRTLRTDGTVVAQSPTVFSSGNDPNPQKLSFGPQPKVTDGYYELGCSLLPSTRLIMYNVVEE